MQRVLHLIDTGGPGGAETILIRLAAHFREPNWDSRVLLRRHGWLRDRLVGLGVDTAVIPSGPTPDLRLLSALRKEIRRLRPHLIHAHLLGSGVYGSVAAALTGDLPLVCTFHGIPDVDPDDRLLPVKARILSRARNRIVYVSQHLRRYLEPLLGVPDRMGRTIHNGVDLTGKEDMEDHSPELGFEPGDVLVGAVGNIRTAKDYGNLLTAARIVCDVRTDTHFAIVGEGSGALWEGLLAVRDRLRLAEHVHFLGFRRDIPALLRRFDLFVSSSSDEGLPLASVEAMGAGKPVVLTRCGGVPELVEDGKNGLLVPVRDPVALAGGILHLLKEKDLAARLGSAAASTVREKFSLETMLKAYEALYLDLIHTSDDAHA